MSDMSSGDSAHKVRLAGLDAVRVFAAGAVMLFHLGYWSWAVPSTARAIVQDSVRFAPLLPFAFWGRFGVETFFVVSGFVIAFSAAQATPWRFARSRVLRLVPAALISATITLLVMKAIAFQPDTQIARYVTTITFNPFGPWIDNVYWTLGIEISFYAAVLALLVVGRFAWLEPIMIALGCYCALPWLLRAAQVDISMPQASADARVQELLLLQRGAYFAVGVLLWYGFFLRWTPIRIAALAICAIGGAVQIYFGVPAILLAQTTTPLMLEAAAIWLLSVGAVAASIHWDAAIQAKLGVKGLRALKVAGLATYPLYLLHDIVGSTTLRRLVAVGVPQYVALVGAFCAMWVLALAVTVFLEPLVRAPLAAAIGAVPRLSGRTAAS